MVTWGIFVIFLIYFNFWAEIEMEKKMNPLLVMYAFTIAMLLMKN
jgi:hypothetical protein